jgi:glyoxylase-like metal-dependent hydrolase (beta-lactamase superfamily II)
MSFLKRTAGKGLDVERIQVGPWPMNCYLVRCAGTGKVAIVDPGADPESILVATGATGVCCVLLTHGHPDHVGALDAVRRATGVPVGIHPADAGAFGVEADFPLLDGMEVEVGRDRVSVVHVPGHTPGSVCFRPLDCSAAGWVLVGDAIFPGGPGHTGSPAALEQSLLSLARTVFTWPDEVRLLPGHGEGTTVGAEREAFERFMASEHPADLAGDVTWR